MLHFAVISKYCKLKSPVSESQTNISGERKVYTALYRNDLLILVYYWLCFGYFVCQERNSKLAKARS